MFIRLNERERNGENSWLVSGTQRAAAFQAQAASLTFWNASHSAGAVKEGSRVWLPPLWMLKSIKAWERSIRSTIMHVCSVPVQHEESSIGFCSTESAEEQMTAEMFLHYPSSPLGGALWRKCFGMQSKYKCDVKTEMIRPSRLKKLDKLLISP